MKMTVADIVVPMLNAFWDIAFVKRVSMVMERHAKKMYVILIPAKIVEHVFQQIRLMTANARWDGPGHTVKLDSIAFQIHARMEEPAFQKKMDTDARVLAILKEMIVKKQILVHQILAKTPGHAKK